MNFLKYENFANNTIEKKYEIKDNIKVQNNDFYNSQENEEIQADLYGSYITFGQIWKKIFDDYRTKELLQNGITNDFSASLSCQYQTGHDCDYLDTIHMQKETNNYLDKLNIFFSSILTK